MKKNNNCNCLNAMLVQSYIALLVDNMKKDDHEVYIYGQVICKDCHKSFNITYPKLEILELKLMFGEKKRRNQ